jgi:hypothetical protein
MAEKCISRAPFKYLETVKASCPRICLVYVAKIGTAGKPQGIRDKWIGTERAQGESVESARVSENVME